VGHAADRDLLQLFGERTRLPGASAYNSIAVVQKWEHLDPDPLAEVRRKCARLRDQLQGQVAEVLPTSGLLANVCMYVSPETWAMLARLATASAPEAVDDLLLSPEYGRQFPAEGVTGGARGEAGVPDRLVGAFGVCHSVGSCATANSSAASGHCERA
jgi:hypothetical protein